MKTLDLTYVLFCNEKREIAKRNKRAMEYSNNVKAKQRKIYNLKENLLMLATVFCANATIMYVLIDAFL